MKIYEVAVVGGGIAGAAAVISLSLAGVDCIWLRPEFVDQPHRVGESLAPAANPILKSLGLSSLLDTPHHRRSNSTFSAWGKPFLVERNAAIHLEGAGYVIDRNRFEKDLYACASESADVIVDGSLQSCHAELGVWYLSTDLSSDIQCRFLVDATGRAQSIGRTLARSHNYDYLAAVYGFLNQKENSDVRPTPATLIETVDTGWWYASLLPSGELTVNYYSDPDLLPKGLTNKLEDWISLIGKTKHIAHWIEDAEFVIDKPPEIASAATRCLSASGGVHEDAPWAAIGDAAASFDPLSAHGMTTALWAAARLPDIVASSLQLNHALLDDYVNAVAKGVSQFLEQRTSMYAYETRFKNAPFWELRAP